MFHSANHQEIHHAPPEPTPESWRRQTLFGHEQDGAAFLPPLARAKLKRLRESADVATMLSVKTYEDYQEARAKSEQIKARIAELTAKGSREAAPLIAAETESLSAFKALMDEILSELAARRAVKEDWHTLVRRLERYLAQIRTGANIAEAAPAPIKIGKGQTHIELVERIRAQIDKERADLQTACDAPIHSDEAKRIARSHIEGLAALGRPNVLVTIEGRRPPLFATQHRMLAAGDDLIDTPRTLAWLFRDELIAALEREIDADADDASALTDEDRAKRIERATSTILALEREEEAAIEAAAASGMNISRRVDADPRAVLGLSDDLPAPNATEG